MQRRKLKSNLVLSILSLSVMIGLFACGIKAHQSGDDPGNDDDFALGASSESGKFRGYVKINQVLTDRLVEPGEDFAMSDYLEKSTPPEDGSFDVSILLPGLKDLLGKNDGNGLASGYRNGEPNSINMLLWYVLFSGLGQDIHRICDPAKGDDTETGGFKFRTEFVKAIKPFCGWPEDSARNDETIARLWEVMMQYDAPKSEYAKWHDYVLSDDLKKLKADKALVEIFVSAYYNPYFLMQH